MLFDHIDVAVDAGGRMRTTHRYAVVVRDRAASDAAMVRAVYIPGSGNVKALRGWIVKGTSVRDVDQRQAIDAALSTGHRVWLVGGFLLPPRDVFVPDSLPAPPLPETGWNSMPYELLWSKQVGGWLNARGTGCRNVDPGVQGGRLENAHLLVCEGWRKTAPDGEK